ncbi:RluA family pseudouridine synthase [uncultured Ferrovibrio sp.]|jgi:23S rRNA pseudouridine1911/1915/1917 synthase|uniref:RluA family pseudouridine synthase n=1 Tax=uncultured Ferrovibrio sp. TaxID=1576913 RepID=UPI00262EACC6|nr:RluA family pseudouridine synthase [uncultured Ferrovibrio sp.]
MTDAKTIQILPPVPEEAAGERLDRHLAALLSGNEEPISRSRLKALIQEGHVRLAQGGATITDPSRKIKPGEVYEVGQPAPAAAEPEAQAIPLTIVYEDDQLIVIDKPPGLVVHPAPGNPDRTLVNALLHHCGDSLSGIGGVKRPGIVHRIDKDTSGLVVAAKTDRAHQALAGLFASHDIERSYDALVWGHPNPPHGTIEGPIGRDPRDRKRMAIVSKGGKPAVTHYTTRKLIYDRKGRPVCALVRCDLETGRTHQIRVHMTSRGHALIGDQTYGGRRSLQRFTLSDAAHAALRDFSRQALHAATLGFRHPASGEMLRFESPLPKDFAALLAALTETP